MNDQRITFVIPSRDNLEFLKLAVASIKELGRDHVMLVLDDASSDGTQEWLEQLNNSSVLVYRNPGPERRGIVSMFDKGIEMAPTDIIVAFHADMVAGRDFDLHILKHLKEKTVVSGTRIEPPLHGEGPEKIIRDFGVEAELFNAQGFRRFVRELFIKYQHKTSKGIFAPWCMYKADFLEIGGHDRLFAPQSREDSDLFNRLILNGFDVIQSWDALVYHFTSRGSRFNPKSGGKAGQDSPEWKYTNHKNERNFIRKWGHPVRHDRFLYPQFYKRFNKGIVLESCSMDVLHFVEPWFDTIYCKDESLKEIYIKNEQPHTDMDLSLKFGTGEPHNDIVVSLKNCSKISQIKHLAELPGVLDGMNFPENSDKKLVFGFFGRIVSGPLERLWCLLGDVFGRRSFRIQFPHGTHVRNFTYLLQRNDWLSNYHQEIGNV